MELNNRVVFITGISKGIGKAITQKLLKNNAYVVGFGLHAPTYKHENLLFYKTNVRHFLDVEASVKKALKEFPDGSDILINNSGLGYFGMIEDFSLEQWDEIFEVNVNSIFYMCKMLLPKMKEKGKGHIINISSIAGLIGNAQGSLYSGAKFAVRGISECLFKELRNFGIKVTCVYPGSTKTDFFDNSPGINAHDNMMTAEEVAEQVVRAIQTSDNFLLSELVFRPLQPKPKG